MIEKLHSASPEVRHILVFFGLENLHIKNLTIDVNRSYISCSYYYYATAGKLTNDFKSCNTTPDTLDAVLKLLNLKSENLVSVKFKVEAGELARIQVASEVNSEAVQTQPKTFKELIEAEATI